MGVAVKKRSKVKVKTQLVQRLEAVALAWMDISRRLGCRGNEMQLIARAIAFQLIEAVFIEALDQNGITIGEFECAINYETHSIEVDGAPEFEIDPRQPIADQISRAFKPLLRDVNEAWNAEGAASRQIKVRFCADVRADEHRLGKARQLLGVSPHASDWGDYEPVLVGSFSPGRMRETNYQLRSRKRKGS